MRIGGYEWVKLLRRRLFPVLSVLLIVANGVTFYACEQQDSRFFYAYRQRAQYARFLQGEADADPDGYYQWDWEEQERYIASYPSFVEEMGDRAERMGRTAFYQNRESYAYRNLVKSQTDFAPLQGLELKIDNRFGVTALAGYDSGALFLLAFLGMLTYCVLFSERDRGLLLLLKGTQKGHAPLALAKLGAMLCAAAGYTLLQEGTLVLLAGRMYGYGDLNRPIQSVSLFRNCARMLTVGEGLLAIIAIRMGVALFLAALLFCIGMAVKSEGEAAICSGGILGLSYLFSRALSVGGSLNGLKCVNPFYCWHMRWALGDYLNLDLFGWPVGKEACTIVAAVVLAALFSAAGILTFCKTCQIKPESRLEGLMRRLRSRLGVLTRRTGLVYYEFYKMMIQQKKGVVFLLLVVWTVWRSIGVFGVQYYERTNEAAYQSYMEQLQGPVTAETFALVEAEEARLDGLAERLDGADDWERLLIVNELVRLEQGFAEIQTQLERLSQKPGSIEDKLLMNEAAYVRLWNDTDTDVLLWLVGSAAVIFFTGGVYTADEKRQLSPLLRATLNGRERLDRSRDRCILLTAGAVFFLTELPLGLTYFRIDGFASAGQRLCDFTSVDFGTGLPLAVLLALALVLKAGSFGLAALLGRRLSRTLKSELLADLTGIGAVAAVAVILYRCHLDINTMLMGLL